VIDRAKLLELLGPFPKRVPLESRRLDVVDCGSYLREKVEYSTEPDERVSAYVCVPKECTTESAAVLCHHQHNFDFTLGKSEVVGLAGNPDQAYVAALAERGYITFSPDAIAFEERNWSGGTFEAASYELASRLVRGHTLLAKVLHDASVGIDYLASRSDVDAERIGILGHSYGGRMAIWLAAVDHRIRAAASHCGCVGYADSLHRGAGIQMEFCVANLLNHGDMEEVVKLVAPTPLYFYPGAAVVHYSRTNLSYAILCGLLNALGAWALFAALKRGGKASIVAPLTALYPVVVIVLVPLVLHESVSRLQWVGVACSMIAVLLLSA
jgi:uncharacterized membrane protein/dienelactone hydrolase